MVEYGPPIHLSNDGSTVNTIDSYLPAAFDNRIFNVRISSESGTTRYCPGASIDPGGDPTGTDSIPIPADTDKWIFGVKGSDLSAYQFCGDSGSIAHIQPYLAD
jgi:hypothetical protein